MEIPALNGVSLSIATGEFVSIMGSSGSGKSTFMNVLGCLDVPTRGSYFLDGIEVGSLKRDELAQSAESEDRVRLPGIQSPLSDLRH